MLQELQGHGRVKASPSSRLDTIRLSIDQSSVSDLMGGSDEVLIFINSSNLSNRLGILMSGLPPEVVFSPSRHLLDRPHPLFRDNGKAVLYASRGCGVGGMERILVKITLNVDRVIWSDFDHQISLRSVDPNIDPDLKFIFDRKQYECELSKDYVVKNDVYFDYMRGCIPDDRIE